MGVGVPQPVNNEVTASTRYIDIEALTDEQKLTLALELLDDVSDKMEQRLAWRTDVSRLVSLIERV